MRIYRRGEYVLSGIAVLDKDGGRKPIIQGPTVPRDAVRDALSGGMWFDLKLHLRETDPKGRWFGEEPKELQLR